VRKTATQKFLEGGSIEKVEHPPRELEIHLGGGRVFRVRAFADGWNVKDYGLDFIFEENGKRLDGKMRPVNEIDDGREVPTHKRCQAVVDGSQCPNVSEVRVWTGAGGFRACAACREIWGRFPDQMTWMIDPIREETPDDA
jgi:hypothetical protein